MTFNVTSKKKQMFFVKLYVFKLTKVKNVLEVNFDSTYKYANKVQTRIISCRHLTSLNGVNIFVSLRVP